MSKKLNPETVAEAARHALKLEKQGKTLSDALAHARHRYGVPQTAIRLELCRQS